MQLIKRFHVLVFLFDQDGLIKCLNQHKKEAKIIQSLIYEATIIQNQIIAKIRQKMTTKM